MKLRPWQQEAREKALKWLLEAQQDRHFLINAAPGAGKTIAASAIAAELIRRDEIDRVVVLAPRSEVVNQWSNDFHLVTRRHMSKVTGRDSDLNMLGTDVCATWAAVQGLSDALQAFCQSSRVLVICDEHHHAAIEAAWGDNAESAFAAARFVLVLTGTPIRSDGAQSVWLAYDSAGAISHPEAGTYTLTYGEAVDLAYCRPVTFHRHQGHFTVDLDDGRSVAVSGNQPAQLPPELNRVGGLQRALDFYRLACTPQFESDQSTPLRNGYQASMLEWAGAKLSELRNRMPEAGGLVITHSIEMAKYMAKLIELLEGEAPMLVHSQTTNIESKIRAFRSTDRRWIVSVAMISEGVDIKRLRVLVYLPNALTELAFRQAVGRVVRSFGPDDDTRAYMVMPSLDTFEAFARSVEDEMSPAARAKAAPAKAKVCPTCRTECALAETTCPCCGHEFPAPKAQFKSCHECGALNPTTADECQSCGAAFRASFVLTLDQALREGAIVRGMDLDESEVAEAERIAAQIRRDILRSGDARIAKMLAALPEESWGRLKQIVSAS
jgi:superfamily II DNA or RNA helicase